MVNRCHVLVEGNPCERGPGHDGRHEAKRMTGEWVFSTQKEARVSEPKFPESVTMFEVYEQTGDLFTVSSFLDTEEGQPTDRLFKRKWVPDGPLYEKVGHEWVEVK